MTLLQHSKNSVLFLYDRVEAMLCLSVPIRSEAKWRLFLCINDWRVEQLEVYLRRRVLTGASF